MQTRESQLRTVNGWGMLFLMLAAGVGLAAWLWWTIAQLAATRGQGQPPWPLIALLIGWALALVIWLICWNGFYTLQPNQAAVLILFGKYRGTDRESGFRFTNPLMTKNKVSLRARNLNMHTIKVNDQRGNPIEIAAVVVWKVSDTAQAIFDVDNFEQYVTVQSEAALRHLASAYPYDTTEEHVMSLRGNLDDVSVALRAEVQGKVDRAGVQIEEARLSHLAYAPEIASAMLQRQQAEAIVAARTRIVDGAVGIVEMALEKLAKHELVKLDEERKAAMVNNLLVVLCGDKSAHPVVHAGTLYT